MKIQQMFFQGICRSIVVIKKEVYGLEKKELNRLVKERISGKIQKIPSRQKNLFPEDAELKVWDEIRDKLKEIDVTRVKPTSHILPVNNVFRRDKPIKSLNVKDALSNAPAQNEGFFLAPKVIE